MGFQIQKVSQYLSENKGKFEFNFAHPVFAYTVGIQYFDFHFKGGPYPIEQFVLPNLGQGEGGVEITVGDNGHHRVTVTPYPTMFGVSDDDSERNIDLDSSKLTLVCIAQYEDSNGTQNLVTYPSAVVNDEQTASFSVGSNTSGFAPVLSGWNMSFTESQAISEVSASVQRHGSATAVKVGASCALRHDDTFASSPELFVGVLGESQDLYFQEVTAQGSVTTDVKVKNVALLIQSFSILTGDSGSWVTSLTAGATITSSTAQPTQSVSFTPVADFSDGSGRSADSSSDVGLLLVGIRA